MTIDPVTESLVAGMVESYRNPGRVYPSEAVENYACGLSLADCLILDSWLAIHMGCVCPGASPTLLRMAMAASCVHGLPVAPGLRSWWSKGYGDGLAGRMGMEPGRDVWAAEEYRDGWRLGDLERSAEGGAA